MFRNVLVPLDGSPLAEEALAAAVAISRRTSARLHLAHVRMLYRPPGEEVAGDPARTYLDGACERVCAEIGESVSFAVLPEEPPRMLLPAPSPGTVAALLHGYARDNDIDLVVMATHGRSGISRVWFGSVADALLRTCTLPVLLIRPKEGDAKRRWLGAHAFSHVLVPLDGSEHAHAAIAPARAFATAFGCRISVLRVLATPYQALDGLVPAVVVFTADQAIEVEEAAQRELARVSGQLRADGVDVDATTVTAPSIPNAILDFARQNAVDLIVLATHARSGIDRVLIGSVADKVVRGADCPVLVVREPAPRDGAVSG